MIRLGPKMESKMFLRRWVLAIAIVAVNGEAVALPAIGDRFEASDSESRQLMGVSPSQISPFVSRNYAGVTYEIAQGVGGRIAYISTHDAKFVTPEGLSVGATFADVRKASIAQPRTERGWASFVELPSGWFASFAEGLDDRPLSPESRVTSFFRRK